MEYVWLKNAKRKTTRLGFGFNGVDNDSVKLLEAAYEAGIRHFDVARSYGHGYSERILGRFAKRHPGEITITTKYGILAPSRRPAFSLARRILKPLVKPLRRMKSIEKGVSAGLGAMYKRGQFTEKEALESLDYSLRELMLERIDIFLLHEPTVKALESDELLRCLEKCVADGRIGDFGIGANSIEAKKILCEEPQYCRVIQTDWSILAPSKGIVGEFTINYRAIAQNPIILLNHFTQNPEVYHRWCDELGVNIGDRGILVAVLLKAALIETNSNIVLFSSHDTKNIVENVKRVYDSSYDSVAKKFIRLVEAERIGRAF